MKWWHGKPDKDGYYWWGGLPAPCVVKVEIYSSGDAYAYFVGHEIDESVESMLKESDKWAGPIDLPTD